MRLIVNEIESLAHDLRGKLSLCVRNIRGAVDLSLNEDMEVVAASTIKVPIFIEALRQVRDGVLSLDEICAVTPQLRCDGSGVLSHLHDGIEVSVRDLLTLMIIVSDNTATNIMVDRVGMDNVNNTLRSLGYAKTRLQRKMYDWEAIAAGRDNYIVASEAADMLARAARRELLGKKWDEMLLSTMGAQQFTANLGLLLPEGVLANKTGQVNDAVNDCGLVTTPDFCYSIAVFTQGAKSIGEAQVTIGRISKLIYDAALSKSC